MKRGTIKTRIGFTKDDWYEIRGYVSRWFGAYANKDMPIPRAHNTGWRVVHLGTGQAPGDGLKTLKQAKLYITWLESVEELHPAWEQTSAAQLIKRVSKANQDRLGNARRQALVNIAPESKPLGSGSAVQDSINAGSLKFSCGRAITCRCGQVFDAPQAVEITTLAGKDIKGIDVLCCRCWEHMEKRLRRIAKDYNRTLEIIDGRLIDWSVYG